MNDAIAAIALGRRIDLTREPDFAIAGVQVRPTACEVTAGGRRIRLQPRVMQVLIALARARCQPVSREALIEVCWGRVIVSEDALNRCIQRLRRLAETEARGAFGIETIPRLGYRLTADPDFAGEADAAGPPRGRRRYGLMLAGGLAFVVLLAISGGWIWRARQGGYPTFARPAQRSQVIGLPTIAVLAFQSADGGPQARAFAATLTANVADALSRYNVTVVNASAPPAESPDQKARARSLVGSDFVVDGRVLEKDHRFTVTTELLDPRDHVVVYAFDTAQPREGKADVAGEIANHVALTLDASKFSNDLAGKLTAADYTLVARANEAIDRWDVPYVLDQTRRLARRHPDDGELQASLGIASIFTAQLAPAHDRPSLVQLARESLGRAGRLSPRSGLLYIGKAMLVNGPMAMAEQERLTRTSLRLNPTLHVTYNGLGESMLQVGRTDEGVALLRRSVQLDPMSGVVTFGAAHDYINAGRAEDAAQMLARMEAIWPDTPNIKYTKYGMAFFLGTPQQVVALDKEYPDRPELGANKSDDILIVQALLRRDPKSVRAMIDDCFKHYGTSPGQWVDENCLFAMVRLGALDDAFRFAQLAYPDHRNLYPPESDDWIVRPPLGLDPTKLFLPAMKPFRDDPRFWDVAVRAGLVDYWRSTGSWPDFCLPQIEACKGLAASALAKSPARRTN